MGGFVSYLGAVRRALVGRGARRFAVIGAYTRLRCRVAFGRSRSSPGEVKVLGTTLTVPDLPGFTFVFEEIFVRGDYRFETQTSAPVIVDAGANVGGAVLYFKTLYPGASVVAFEPDPAAFEALRANVDSAGWSGVTLHRLAIGGSPGRAALGGARRHGEIGGAGEVEVVRLSEHITEPVDFLKLDVEGAETAVISELSTAAKLGSIDQMAIEYHHHLSGSDDSLSVILGLLEEAGFGYSIEARAPGDVHGYQDVLIRAYRKGSS